MRIHTHIEHVIHIKWIEIYQEEQIVFWSILIILHLCFCSQHFIVPSSSFSMGNCNNCWDWQHLYRTPHHISPHRATSIVVRPWRSEKNEVSGAKPAGNMPLQPELGSESPSHPDSRYQQIKHKGETNKDLLWLLGRIQLRNGFSTRDKSIFTSLKVLYKVHKPVLSICMEVKPSWIYEK